MQAQHRDLVADDVVEVSGDAESFFGHSSGGFDLAGGDGTFGPFLQDPPMVSMDAERAPCRPSRYGREEGGGSLSRRHGILPES
ncbi:hypothetical protein GCM10009646_65940 [Streptomyces aureus]